MRLAGCTFLPWGREDHGIGSGGSVRVDLGSPQFSRGFAEAGPRFLNWIGPGSGTSVRLDVTKGEDLRQHQ
jgi:hypothetical protein